MMKLSDSVTPGSASKRAGRKVTCSKCGVTSEPGANRCASCGSHLYIACSDCGSHNPRSARSCADCGRRLHRNRAKKWVKRIMGRPEEFKIWKLGLLIIALAIVYGVFWLVADAPGL